MSTRRRTACAIAFVLALAGLAAGAGASSKPRPVDHRAFRISGNATQPFVPGSTQSLDLTITNPDDVALTLTGVSVTVLDGTSIANTSNARAGCSGTTNMLVVRAFSGAVNVPANTSESLTAAGATAGQLPQVRMPDRRVNQNRCKNTTFHFTYAGTTRGRCSPGRLTRSRAPLPSSCRNGHNAR